MYTLNLPSFEYQLKKAEDRVWIFDVLRKKYLVLTPEEWVRQHFVHHLINDLGYPRALIRLEGGLSYNQLSKRSDIVVFDRQGAPWMVIECKAPTQPINQSTLRQASVYNTTLRASYLVVTNGLAHYYFGINWQENKTERLEVMPAYT
jgi:hypothetical protein